MDNLKLDILKLEVKKTALNEIKPTMDRMTLTKPSVEDRIIYKLLTVELVIVEAQLRVLKSKL